MTISSEINPLNLPEDPPKKKLIHIVAVAYEKFNHLTIFVQSVINQTADNWFLTVIHDGPNETFDSIMKAFQIRNPDRISFFHTDERYNDYGHTLREIGIRRAHGDYLLLTNADNYLIPRMIEFVNEPIESAVPAPDVVMYNMIHSHNTPGFRPLPSYSFFETEYRRYSLDMGAAVVKMDLAKRVGFRDKGYAGDATYFEDVQAAKLPEKLAIVKLPMVLFVHN